MSRSSRLRDEGHPPTDPLSSLSPRMNRRSATRSIVPPPPPRDQAAIPFRQNVVPGNTTSHHLRRGTNTTDAELLGVGPSLRLRRSARPSPALSDRAVLEDNHVDIPLEKAMSRESVKSWTAFMDSLSKDEIGVVETRFDLMRESDLKEYLDAFDFASHPRPSTSTSRPSTPIAEDISKKGLEDLLGDEDRRLFPPSPPSLATQREVLDHPLKILSRAVRELREAVERLQRENASLREEVSKEAGRAPRQAADQISIHEDLSEALSTSLTASSPVRELSRNPITLKGPSNHSIRSISPAPSTSRSIRPKSPTSSIYFPFPVSPIAPDSASTRSISSVNPSTPDGQGKKAHRASWTSGLWVWSGGKPRRRPRKGSVGSIASQSGLGRSVGERVPEDALLDEEEDEAWRKGDGGSSPAFRAVFLATRILTSDASSILVSSAISTSSLVARLAHTLVSNARDQGIVARDPPGRRRSGARSRAVSVVSQDETDPTGSSHATPTGRAAKMETGNRDYMTYGDQALAATASIGRSLLSSVSNATVRAKSASLSAGSETIRPSLLSRVSTSRPFPTTAISTATPTTPPATDSPPPSVELSSIVPDESRPPTVLLSRQNLGGFFQSNKNRTLRLQTASRFESDEPPLTDRYGFIYDLQHASMLKDASVAGVSAPASLNGTLPSTSVPNDMEAESEAEGWIAKRRRSAQEHPSHQARPSQTSRNSHDSGGRVPSPSPRPSRDSSTSSSVSSLPSQSSTNTPSNSAPTPVVPMTSGLNGHAEEGNCRERPALADSTQSQSRSKHRQSAVPKLNPSLAKPITAKDSLTVSSRGAGSLRPQAEASATAAKGASISSALAPSTHSTHATSLSAMTLPISNSNRRTNHIKNDSRKDREGTDPSPNPSRLTISSLLDQLTDIHDRHQKDRTTEWDVFLRRRAKSAASGGGSGNGGYGGGGSSGGGEGLLGINHMAEEDVKVLRRLVRGGIPLVYRSDVWAECSGAKDMMVPGEYAEILSVHKDDTSPFLKEIEKDVTRTFPGNVFFGGDGPGVAKLRRVLVAYSWYNPEVGYCQGMNMLAATLLLTHTDEEQAYWTLISLLTRLLPTGYYTPNLLSSRADQLVLADLIAQLMPKLANRLEAVGVELAGVTFGWFLSLFTDCLPVETLFRVWDVLFVEGHVTLFRVAIAVLKLHEPDIIACESASEVFGYMGSMTSRLWSADRLIAAQHSYKPVIRPGDIKKRCEKHVAALMLQEAAAA